MSRVKGRKFRPIDVNNRLHRLGNANTTGTYGQVSTWNVRVSHSKKLDPKADMAMAAQIQVHSGMPGKRRAAKRKRVARTFPGLSNQHFDHKHKKQLRRLRADILTIQLLDVMLAKPLFPMHAVNSLRIITEHLHTVQSKQENEEMDRADKARILSLRGMIASGSITYEKAQPLPRFWNRVNSALMQIKGLPKREPVPHEFKPEPQYVYTQG